MQHRTFEELSDKEQGALLLAFHRGEIMEFSHHGDRFVPVLKPTWHPNQYYRVKPEPKVETQTLWGSTDGHFLPPHHWDYGTKHTFTITVKVVDGVVDPKLCKVEKV